jgi:hypothetical protein
MAATEPDFDAVFDRLKAILEPYARELYVSADDGKTYGWTWHRRPSATPQRGLAPSAGASAT